jgi:hypothetical protein
MESMAKILDGLFDREGPSKKEIEEVIKKQKKGKTICYVLLTCNETSEEGTMEVDMKYEGERWLAAYLVESAQKVLEEEEEEDGS